MVLDGCACTTIHLFMFYTCTVIFVQRYAVQKRHYMYKTQSDHFIYSLH